jgi:methylated-DNA-[protein]-cysteine S-methyltransferase
MGQSAKSRPVLRERKNLQISAACALELSLFETDLGWFGVWGADGKVVSLCFGHVSADEVRRDGDRSPSNDAQFGTALRRDWAPALRRRLVQFASGARVDFSNVDVSLPPLSEFQRQVVMALRRVRYGQTVSYGRLAELAGYPGAARAVGSVMAANRVPIIIPCHRVVAAGNRLGGFSSPLGVQMKRQLLDLEAQGLLVSQT